MSNLFIYGTLQHIPLLKEVLGHADFEVCDARLSGHVVWQLPGTLLPALGAGDDAATGLFLSDLSAEDLARLDFFELAHEAPFERREVQVSTASGPQSATAYFPDDVGQQANRWDFAAWEQGHAGWMMLAAAELMQWFGKVSPQDAATMFPTMKMRAASAERAGKMATPCAVRSPLTAGQLDISRDESPYARYFAVREVTFRHPTFDGGMSNEVLRAAFMGADAVTVLPYDPASDLVLLIEQFRFAPFVRGDHRPWLVEPVAGRIDPGESPQEAAHRELAEEAHLRDTQLIELPSYYPSTGAWSEYLYSYVALCDLSGERQSLAGLDAEDEDIRTHILPFDDAMALIDTGEADCAPLLISLLWLARERPRLRASA